MDKVWKNNYKNLCAYIKEKKHYSELYSDAGAKRTSAWLLNQIELIKKVKLEDDKKELILKLGIDTGESGLQWAKWLKIYLKLNKFYLNNGHSNVSQLEKTIGPWLSSQRVKYRRSELSETQKHLLEKIEVCWDPAKKQEDNWKDKFNMLIEYKKIHGHVNVQRTKNPDPGVWVSAQRTAYRKGTLSSERIKMLESIGFEWSIK